MIPHASYHPPVKRSVSINGHQTSISLEPVFWDMLKSAAQVRSQSVNMLVAHIDCERIKSPTPPGLASAIRVWLVLEHRAEKWEPVFRESDATTRV